MRPKAPGLPTVRIVSPSLASASRGAPAVGLMSSGALLIIAAAERLTGLQCGWSTAAGRPRATCTPVMVGIRRRVATVRVATAPQRARPPARAIPRAATTLNSYHSYGVAKPCGRPYHHAAGGE